MARLTEAQREFLTELAFENPAPEEPWRYRENWDPPFPLAVIDAAQRKGLIETCGSRHSEEFAYRFTAAGRAALSEGDGK